MTIEWLAGNRLRGTTAERPSASLPSGSVGGWVEVGRTTLDSTGNNIDVSSLPDKRYYMFLTHAPTDSSGYVLDRYRLNADTDPNYSYRGGLNGAAFGTGGVSQSEGIVLSDGASIHQSGEIFTMGHIANVSDKEKLLIGNTVHNEATGSASVPDRGVGVGKHAQTSNPVTSVNCVNTNNSGFASGSEVVVLGWDPDDTHTTNFWEELASVELSSASNGISTGTFTPKKYLWLQYHIPSSGGGANNYDLRVGNDTIDSGSNRYCFKYNINGANGDTSATNQTRLKLSFNGGSGSEWSFGNVFIINNASTEKLFISHANRNHVSGSTASNASPNRYNVTGKWIESTNQINIMELYHQTEASTFGEGTIIKVWGSD